MPEDLSTLLRELENKLLDPTVRQSPAELGRLLADEFVEFGSSGNVYHKQDCVGGIPPVRIDVSDFQARLLAPGLALVTYRAFNHEPSRPHLAHTLRSSIWKLIGGQWQMIFHQGTSAAPPGDAPS
jgi:hypothetical protein